MSGMDRGPAVPGRDRQPPSGYEHMRCAGMTRDGQRCKREGLVRAWMVYHCRSHAR